MRGVWCVLHIYIYIYTNVIQEIESYVCVRVCVYIYLFVGMCVCLYVCRPRRVGRAGDDRLESWEVWGCNEKGLGGLRM